MFLLFSNFKQKIQYRYSYTKKASGSPSKSFEQDFKSLFFKQFQPVQSPIFIHLNSPTEQPSSFFSPVIFYPNYNDDNAEGEKKDDRGDSIGQH